jgi:predicted transcriptional regulator of viral defense system
MKWDDFLDKYAEMPVIDTDTLTAGITDSGPLKVQLSRWVKAEKLIQAKRGIYLLAEKYRRTALYEPYLASLLKRPSYISLEKALEYHGLIPEAVPVFTSLTTKRQGRFASEAGTFVYRHIKTPLFWGYESVTVNRQVGFIASPEKALLDLLYLNGMKISQAYLRGLRLQNVGKINKIKLLADAKRFRSAGILRAAKAVETYIGSYRDEEKTL